MRLQHLAIAQVHVNTAGQAWIEASDCPHDIDALEVFRTVFLEDRCVLHRVFVRPGRAKAVTRVGVPGGWRIGMIVGDLVVLESPRDATSTPRTASWKPHPIASSGTLKSFHVLVLPACSSASACSAKYRAAAAAYAWK